MVYYDDMCNSKLGKLMCAFRADRPSEWKMDEFIRYAEDMHNEILKLKAEQKDAERYRFLRDSSIQNVKTLFTYGDNVRKQYWDEYIDSEILSVKQDTL